MSNQECSSSNDHENDGLTLKTVAKMVACILAVLVVLVVGLFAALSIAPAH